VADSHFENRISRSVLTLEPCSLLSAAKGDGSAGDPTGSTPDESRRIHIYLCELDRDPVTVPEGASDVEPSSIELAVIRTPMNSPMGTARSTSRT
jgi:hypothetical protein